MFHCDDFDDVSFYFYFITKKQTKAQSQFFLHCQLFLPKLALLKDFTKLENSAIKKFEK